VELMLSYAEGQQVGAALKGFANAIGLGGVIKQVSDAAQQASMMASCPVDGTLAPAGTKFCPECGSPMTQPSSDKCPQCGAPVKGAKFCPECGAKIEQPVLSAAVCPNCGTVNSGNKFCSSSHCSAWWMLLIGVRVGFEYLHVRRVYIAQNTSH
jgi:predicted amidophosphoribosyltransferase